MANLVSLWQRCGVEPGRDDPLRKERKRIEKGLDKEQSAPMPMRMNEITITLAIIALAIASGRICEARAADRALDKSLRIWMLMNVGPGNSQARP